MTSRSSFDEVRITTGMAAVRGSPLMRLSTLVTVKSRQLQVQQDELRRILNAATGIRSGAEQELERLHAVARDVNVIREIGALEGMQHELDVVGIVFNQ
jgi:hypothetical protein